MSGRTSGPSDACCTSCSPASAPFRARRYRTRLRPCWNASRTGRLCPRKPPRKSANCCASVCRRMRAAGCTTSRTPAEPSRKHSVDGTAGESPRLRRRWRRLAIGAALWLRGPARPPDRSKWVQLTKLPDSVSQPALSPDGRMLAFIRGPSTFFGPGQIYVKILPDGEPVQLTHDSLAQNESGVFAGRRAHRVYHRGSGSLTGTPGWFRCWAASRNNGCKTPPDWCGPVRGRCCFRRSRWGPHGDRDGRGEPDRPA